MIGQEKTQTYFSSDIDSGLKAIAEKVISEERITVKEGIYLFEKGELGFLADKRRLNVALTRAKRGLIIVGNPQTLKRDETWKSWLEWIEERELMAWHYR